MLGSFEDPVFGFIISFELFLPLEFKHSFSLVILYFWSFFSENISDTGLPSHEV